MQVDSARKHFSGRDCCMSINVLNPSLRSEGQALVMVTHDYRNEYEIVEFVRLGMHFCQLSLPSDQYSSATIVFTTT